MLEKASEDRLGKVSSAYAPLRQHSLIYHPDRAQTSGSRRPPGRRDAGNAGRIRRRVFLGCHAPPLAPTSMMFPSAHVPPRPEEGPVALSHWVRYHHGRLLRRAGVFAALPSHAWERGSSAVKGQATPQFLVNLAQRFRRFKQAGLVRRTYRPVSERTAKRGVARISPLLRNFLPVPGLPFAGARWDSGARR